MNLKRYISGFATVTLAAIAFGAFEISSKRNRPLATPPVKTTTYYITNADLEALNSNDLKSFERLEKFYDDLRTHSELFNDDFGRLCPAELEEIRPVTDRRVDYTSKLVDALREGSVKDKQKRLSELVGEYVCSLSSGLILDGRAVYRDPQTPQALILIYQDDPLVPLDTLFKEMGGSGSVLGLRNAFEVYARSAYGLKPSLSETETIVTLSCNEVSK